MVANQMSLWGEEFTIKEDTNAILAKLKNPKSGVVDASKIVKSTKIDNADKMEFIKGEVHRILGHFADDTQTIKSRDELHKYIDAAIENGIIAVDTETNNSLDPLTCKIMGLCIYTPGQKNAYVPVNHVDPITHKHLDWQVTEKDIFEELSRLGDTKCVFHNGKFDYMVIYYTCGIKIPIWWDTMIGSQLLDENESAGLKYQYRTKIDKDQEKYDIDKLFGNIPYELFDPELFALYAASDAYETYKLYEYQREQFKKLGSEKLYKLFTDIEMPVVTVTAEMEMRGVAVDKEFAKRLSNKFHKKLDDLNEVIRQEMSKYDSIISEWKATPEANAKVMVKGKLQKSLSEKLSDPIELTSPTQLGIFLYDILKVLKVKSDGKKTTDENSLLSIKDVLPLANMILKKREYEKYLGTYIDVLPTYCNPRDNRVHAHFNQMGREDRNVVTGRMSSSDPSLQVIPARGDIVTVRCLFVPTIINNEVEMEDNKYTVPIEDEVLLKNDEYKFSSTLVEGDILESGEIVDYVTVNGNMVDIYIKAGANID